MCSAVGSLKDEVHCHLLPVLPPVPGTGPCLRSVCVPVEQPVARWICLGWLWPSVQLAPCPDGDRSSGAIWQR